LELKDLKEIKAIIDLMTKNDLSVFEIEKEGFVSSFKRPVRNNGDCPPDYCFGAQSINGFS
jgi:hypothetical protein